MGTVVQSLPKNARDNFKKLEKQAVGDNAKRKELLTAKYREIVNRILLESPTTQSVRNQMLSQIAIAVDAEIKTPLETWVKAGRKDSEWPPFVPPKPFNP
jgi:hypothetical protein